MTPTDRLVYHHLVGNPEKLSTTLDQLGCIAARWRPDGAIVYLNAEAVRLLGEEVEDYDVCTLLGCTTGELDELVSRLAGDPTGQDVGESVHDGLVLRWIHRALRGSQGDLVEVVSTGADVTPYHQLTRSLAERERTFKELGDNLRQCVWIKGPSSATTGKMDYMSPAFERIFGVPPEHLFGQPDRLFELIYPEDLPRFRESISTQFEQTYDIEYRVVRPDGSVRWLWSRAAPICDSDDQIVKLVGITEDITERKEAENRIRELNTELERMYRREQELSRTDELTGLGNRHRYIEEADKLLKIIRRQARRTGEPRHLAAILLDVDHFKEINDLHGHATGDACLRALAGVLTATVREVDVPARVGGDEFLVLLPYTSLAEARQVAERVHHALKKTNVEIPGDPTTLTVSASLGVAAVNGQDDDAAVEQLYNKADEALYAAKDAGRGRVVAKG